MTVRPFMAVLPKPAQNGDEIIIKGRVKDDAQLFSVNFTLECCPNPLNIAYHFKTVFANNTVVHNFKAAGNWNNEIVQENSWIEGAGQDFILTFHFTEREIMVYTDDTARCFQYEFEHQFDIADIKSVQVWDDVDYIDEIVFRYQKNH